jgi:hypothetical protein
MPEPDMKYAYIVTLRKSSQKPIDFFSMVLCLSSAVIFFLIARTTYGNPYFFYPIAALIFAGMVYNAAASRRGTKPLAYRFLLMLAAFGWLMMPVAPWIGLIFGILAFLEHQSKRPLEIGFDRDRVVINTLLQQRLDWSVFNNVILKDGLLTLDFKNNRLFQKEVAEEEEEDDVDEEEFNAYCRDQLAAAQGK